MAVRRQGDDGGLGTLMPEEPDDGRDGSLFPLGLMQVEGPSMVPTLTEGDLVVVRFGSRLRPGAVVLARHPLRQNLLVVKRAVERRADGWWLLSDNSGVESDSRDYGAVPQELVLGRVLLRVRPRPAWLAPARPLERLLGRWPLARVPGLGARLGVFRRVSPEL